MKYTTTILFTTVLALPVFAGQPVVTTSKNYKPVIEDCFGRHELQIDVFGLYLDGNGPAHAGPIQEHGWGGGVGVNYFFDYNLGIGVDASWVSADENASLSNDDTIIHHYSGSLIWRFPIQERCIAPYVYVGGGVACDGETWAFGHAGLGLEYRLQPQKLGVFVDARWTYDGDRFGNGDQNNFGGRVGLRWIF